MTDIAIVAAKRTPQGKFLGGLHTFSPLDLAAAAGDAALTGLDPAQIDLVILGQIYVAGHGMNVARQVALRLNLPQAVPAYTVNLMCGSGLHAMRLAVQAIRAGDATTVLCGGVESMSNAPYLLSRARQGYRMGDGVLTDSLLRDGLLDSRDGRHMGQHAEALAERFSITRKQQDDFAFQSHQRAAVAQREGRFAAEIVPVAKLTADECVRGDSPREKLGTLSPAFTTTGSVTAGNASSLSDGAAMLVVTASDTAQKHGWPILALWEESVVVGCDPDWMGLGPVHATQQLLQRTGRKLEDFDAVEINEAFAAQALACLKEFNLPSRLVNADGGAIAMGHPLGASGARLAVHLVQQIAQGRVQRGLATLCIGGGMGIAAAFSAPPRN